MDLYNEMITKLNQLDTSVKTLRKTGRDYARAFIDYRIALAKELIKLKEEGYAITLAGDIARGKPEIAELKYKEICTEAIYKANQEAIMSTKLQIKIIENQLSREYTNES